MAEKSKRKQNWSDKEVEYLVDQCSTATIIDAKFSSKVTGKEKAMFWEECAEKINSLSMCGRTVEEIKKKWCDIKSSIKKKAQTRHKESIATGGGPPPSALRDWEEKVLGKLPKAVVEGIKGGTDALEEQLKRPSIEESSSNGENQCLTPTVLISQQNEEREDNFNISQTGQSTSQAGQSSSSETLSIRSRSKRNRDDTLLELQIEYFKGQVVKQPLEKELLETRLRVLKKAEEKIDKLGPYEILKVFSDDIFTNEL